MGVGYEGGTNKACARAARLLSSRFTLGMGSGAQMAVVARRVGRRSRREGRCILIVFFISIFLLGVGDVVSSRRRSTWRVECR